MPKKTKKPVKKKKGFNLYFNAEELRTLHEVLFEQEKRIYKSGDESRSDYPKIKKLGSKIFKKMKDKKISPNKWI